MGLGAGRLLLDVLARCEGARLKLDAWDLESTLLNRANDLQALAMAHYGRYVHKINNKCTRTTSTHPTLERKSVHEYIRYLSLFVFSF